jgi:hypothetical protein
MIFIHVIRFYIVHFIICHNYFVNEYYYNLNIWTLSCTYSVIGVLFDTLAYIPYYEFIT